MIKLARTTLSAYLKVFLAHCAFEYALYESLNMVCPDSVQHGYRDVLLKERLREESCDKCIYCESKVSHVDHGEIEHFIPKSIQPRLRYLYYNLGYSCGICNNNKGVYYDPLAPLLNPYEDDPSQFIEAYGPMVSAIGGNPRGSITIRKLKLNRTELLERRVERLNSILSLVNQMQVSKDPSIKLVLQQQIEEECADDKEFAFVSRAFVRTLNEKGMGFPASPS
jgi:hypothetical protein